MKLLSSNSVSYIMKNNEELAELKFNILADAISAVEIIDVDVKNPDDNNIHLYLKTSDINSIDENQLKFICKKYSTDKVDVTFQIPFSKIIEDRTVGNNDRVCIFIEKITELDPASFSAFE